MKLYDLKYNVYSYFNTVEMNIMRTFIIIIVFNLNQYKLR